MSSVPYRVLNLISRDLDCEWALKAPDVWLVLLLLLLLRRCRCRCGALAVAVAVAAAAVVAVIIRGLVVVLLSVPATVSLVSQYHYHMSSSSILRCSRSTCLKHLIRRPAQPFFAHGDTYS